MRRTRATTPPPPLACAHLCRDHMDPRPARVWICDNCGAVRGVAVIAAPPGEVSRISPVVAAMHARQFDSQGTKP